MIGPGISMDVASVPRSVQLDAGKIGVKDMRVVVGSSTSVVENIPTAAIPTKVEQKPEQIKEDAALETEKQIKAKKRTEDAGNLLKKYHVEPRVVLRLMTDGGAVAGALEGQAQAEMEILRARGDLSLEQKQKLASAIQEKYKKLIQYSESREESTRGLIKKLEISTNPEDKALLLDIKSVRAQIEQNVHQEKVTQIKEILKTPNLAPEIKTKYEKHEEALETKIAEIEISAQELKEKRDEIKDANGDTVPNVIKEMAVAISGGEASAVKDAEAEPVKYIQEAIVDALTTEGGVAKLADNLVTSTLLTETDKAKFIKDMELGLSKEGMIEMVKNIGGKTTLGFLGVLSMLGYVAWKRSQENGGGQMMG